jgi:hypothetical protein
VFVHDRKQVYPATVQFVKESKLLLVSGTGRDEMSAAPLLFHPDGLNLLALNLYFDAQRRA